MQLAALLAVLPVALLLIFIYKKDSYEKEPIGLLIRLVLFGVISAIPAVFLEQVAELVINSMFVYPSYAYHFVSAFFGVAIIEELVKLLAAYIPTWKHTAFNYKFDGIVYCFYASMGFALIENILYVFSSESQVSLALMRAVLAIPAHGMFSVFMGYYYGEAKACYSAGNKRGKRLNILRGYLTASLLHAFYDFCLFTGEEIMLIPFFIFVIIADVITFKRISKSSKKNEAIYNTQQYRGLWVNSRQLQQSPVYSQGMQQMPQGAYQPQQNPVYSQGTHQASQGAYQPQQNPVYSQGTQQVPQGACQQPQPARPRRLIYCPKCGNICDFNAFNCTRCMTALH